jgi:hypothetical protein
LIAESSFIERLELLDAEGAPAAAVEDEDDRTILDEFGQFDLLPFRVLESRPGRGLAGAHGLLGRGFSVRGQRGVGREHGVGEHRRGDGERARDERYADDGDAEKAGGGHAGSFLGSDRSDEDTRTVWNAGVFPVSDE